MRSERQDGGSSFHRFLERDDHHVGEDHAWRRDVDFQGRVVFGWNGERTSFRDGVERWPVDDAGEIRFGRIVVAPELNPRIGQTAEGPVSFGRKGGIHGCSADEVDDDVQDGTFAASGGSHKNGEDAPVVLGLERSQKSSEECACPNDLLSVVTLVEEDLGEGFAGIGEDWKVAVQYGPAKDTQRKALHRVQSVILQVVDRIVV